VDEHLALVERAEIDGWLTGISGDASAPGACPAHAAEPVASIVAAKRDVFQVFMFGS